MTLLLLRYVTDTNAHYSGVDIECSSVTYNQSLKLSTVYSSLFVDFHKLLGHLFRRQLIYSSFVYHTVLMQMQL